MSMSPQTLAIAITDSSPRLRTMIEALLESQENILAYESGKVHIAFAADQVTSSLEITLSRHKMDKGSWHEQNVVLT